MLRFVAKSDRILNDFIENSAQNATYLSPTYQQNFIRSAASDILLQILNKVRESEVYSIAFDETTDVS